MQEDTMLLIKAIGSLKQETGLFKDYIFPIASAFFTSILGAYAAYFTLKYQEKLQIEKNKLDIINKWLIMADEARETLITFKNKYHGKLTSDPIQRMAIIPTILIEITPVKVSFQELSFIIPKSDVSKKQISSWSQIGRIRSLFHNFNTALLLWGKRNENDALIRKRVTDKFGEPRMDISAEQLLECIGKVDMARHIDLTEKIIKLTDDLIIEFNDFLFEFPEYAVCLIDAKRIQQYGSVLKYQLSRKSSEFSTRSPEPNFHGIKDILKESPEQTVERHKTGYEK